LNIVDHESRITKTMSPYQLVGKMEADWQWERRDELGLGCTAVYKKGRDAGKKCLSKPGKGTDHEGWGPCVAHGGAKRPGRSTAAWLMAHMYAQEYDVSPWEALLLVIRITAGKLRYIESVLASAESDDELEGRPTGQEVVGGPNDGGVEPGRNLSWWVAQSQLERQTLAKVSKAAIDAGVAQLLIEKELRGGEELAQSYVRALEDMEKAGMTDEALEIARGVLRSQLQLALES
jgi:hypothetical protein